MKKLRETFSVAAILICVFGIILSLACNPPVTLYPIDKHDFYKIEAGDCNAVVDGYFMSEFYLNEVLEAKVKGD